MSNPRHHRIPGWRVPCIEHRPTTSRSAFDRTPDDGVSRDLLSGLTHVAYEALRKRSSRARPLISEFVLVFWRRERWIEMHWGCPRYLPNRRDSREHGVSISTAGARSVARMTPRAAIRAL